MACWEERGCGGVTDDCPHYKFGVCPRSCFYTICTKPQHSKASGMETFSAVDVDFKAALKENCHSCKFFLEHAPRIKKH